MNNVICTTSNSTVGCTFIDWSLHFLNGQKNYFRINENQWIPLAQDPLHSVGNAHNHKKNHPMGYINTVEMISNLKNTYSKDFLYSFFPFPEQIYNVCEILSIKSSQLANKEKFQNVLQYQKEDYERLIQHCHQNGIQVVYVHADPKAVGYFWNRRNVSNTEFTGKKAASKDDSAAEFQEIFFNNSIDHWNSLGLTSVWDIRERQALDIRPYDTSKFWTVGFAEPFLHWINCQDLWHSTVDVLCDLMKSLDLKINNDRFDCWLPIAANWQKIQNKNLTFFNNVDYIVECIVNGWNYALDSLTLEQEAIIQHCLIYRHNVNLKTWNLHKFPDNTIELHKILEPNIHTVEKLY